MAMLVAPDLRYHASYVEAMSEHDGGTAGRGAEGRFVQLGSVRLSDPQAFEAFLARLREDELEETPRPVGMVPQTTLWWVEGDHYLGSLSIRHRLTDHLFRVGGHIGYDVRPSARRQGHATAMLAAALPYAYDLGIDPALVTCDDTNVASRKVIEANGGKFDNLLAGKLRYWVPTSG